MAEDLPASVKDAKNRFDLYSDHTLASRLQEEEFGQHYQQNRQERRLVGSDTKTSRVEQMEEIMRQNALRRAQNKSIEESDEEIARRLQAEFEEEEERKRFLKQKQAEADEAYAKALQEEESGRIVGYGSTDAASVSASRQSASATRQRSATTSHSRSVPSGSGQREYIAQNDLNERFAVHSSSSLIDLGAVDAAATVSMELPSTALRPTVIDPFLDSSESRAAAYAPVDDVPLLPPPPAFVLEREQQQPRGGVALPGLTLTPATPPSTGFLPPSTLAPLAAGPPPAYEPALSPDAAPELSWNNPFLMDLVASPSPSSSVQSSVGSSSSSMTPSYSSEFGLPPPSSLALSSSTTYTPPSTRPSTVSQMQTFV